MSARGRQRAKASFSPKPHSRQISICVGPHLKINLDYLPIQGLKEKSMELKGFLIISKYTR